MRSTVADGAGKTVEFGVHGGEDVALRRRQAMPRIEHGRQIGGHRALFQPRQGSEKLTAIEIKAAGDFAITGDDLEAVLA